MLQEKRNGLSDMALGYCLQNVLKAKAILMVSKQKGQV